MTRAHQKQVTQHFVSLSKFDTSIERVMSTMWTLLHSRRSQLIMPTLVGIDVDYNGYPNAVCLLRTFFERLRTVHQNHFVRFVTDTLWAMESNNGDIFYTHDGAKDHRCDAVWHVKIVGTNQFEIGITLSDDHRRFELIDDLSVNLKKFVAAVKGEPDRRQLVDLMTNFYKTTKRVNQIHYLDEPLHILMIPTANGSGYYPMPVYGFSYADARRKGRRAIRELEFHRNHSDELFTTDPTHGELFWMVLGLIQDNDKFGLRQKTCRETYGLVELLLGIYATSMEFNETNHDVIVFHPVDASVQSMVTYTLDMEYMNSLR